MIVVTGLMRSGTTPLSMMLHRIGVKMGDTMRFPPAGTTHHIEWEDNELSEELARIIYNQSDTNPADLIGDYIDAREADPTTLKWGVKTPFLLPFLDIVIDAAKSRGLPLTIIVTHREVIDTFASIDRFADQLPVDQREDSRAGLYLIQKALSESLQHPEQALVFDIKDTWTDSYGTAKRLMEIAHLHSDVALVTSGIEDRSQSWE